MAIRVLNANNVDPDQTPRSAASDLGLHCLPMSLLRDAWYKLVNTIVCGRRSELFLPDVYKFHLVSTKA